MRLLRLKEMSIPGAILLSGLIIGLSVFLTTWIFFGGDNNRQKLFTQTPGSMNRNLQPNNLTPQQIQMIQQQQQQQRMLPSQPDIPTTVAPTAPTAPTAPKIIKK